MSRIYYLGVGLLLCWVLVLIALVLVTDGMNALTVDQNKMALTYMTLALLVSLNITLFGLQRSRKGEQE